MFRLDIGYAAVIRQNELLKEAEGRRLVEAVQPSSRPAPSSPRPRILRPHPAR